MYALSAPFELLLNFPQPSINLNMRAARLPAPETAIKEILTTCCSSQSQVTPSAQKLKQKHHCQTTIRSM